MKNSSVELNGGKSQIGNYKEHRFDTIPARLLLDKTVRRMGGLAVRPTLLRRKFALNCAVNVSIPCNRFDMIRMTRLNKRGVYYPVTF